MTNPLTTPYNISNINIPVTAVFGELDSLCPASKNAPLYASIPGLNTETILGADNFDLIGSNNATLIDILADTEGLVQPDLRDQCLIPFDYGLLDEICQNSSGKEGSCKENKNNGLLGNGKGNGSDSEEKNQAKYAELLA